MPQTVFDVQLSRGVLIVTPVGDAVSFREADVLGGIEGVQERIRGCDPPLVVADLANSGYFGSVIIGALASFAELALEAGGAFAACNVSQQMVHVLKVMQLDERWNIHPNRKAAMKAVLGAAS